MATTLTAGNESTYYSFPIVKTEDAGDGSGDVIVWGKASDGSLDSDLQIVDPEWSAKALQEWYDTGGNVRVQHQAQRDPAGRGIDIKASPDGTWVKSRVVEPVAVKLVRSGVLQDYSVGIINPDIRRGDPKFKHLDPMGKAVNGVITGRDDGMSKIGELSLVDRGSNFGTKFSLIKAAADGTAEWAGELTAPDEVLAKVAEPKVAKTVTVELPKNMRVSVKPSDLAKLATFKQKLVTQTADAVQPPAPVTKTGEPDAAKADLKDSERDSMPASSFAYIDSEGGKHLPVHDEGHVRSALGRFAQQSFESPQARRKAARKIVSRARSMGIDLASHGRVVDAAKGSAKVAKSASAKPQVTKCMKCDGTGMTGEKPCPDCKKGRKAAKKARRMVTKALSAPAVTKKKKVLCGGCGAMQSKKHAMCTECGKPMAGAPPVVKNHDHMCLGCGKAPLDKGESHCPSCGRENPGYLPVADRKLPMNQKAADSAKDRVQDDKSQVKSKKKGGGKGKKGKKPNPFGDKQAPPFGKKDDEKPAKAEKRKGKGKGRKPTEGVTGTPPSMGLPAHREPDGAPIEMFEHTTNLEDGDQHEEMRAAMRHKALAAKGLSQADALLHDLTCPAFAPADVAKAFPYATLGQLDDGAWRQKMLDDAASAPLEQAGQAMALWQHAVTLKSADAELLADLRAGRHGAFLAANKGAFKAFRDATPGPGSFPTPGHMTPQSCRRPYIHEGHAAPSPMHDAPHSFNVPEGQPSAEQYTRDLITAGHAADSPSNDTPRHAPQPAPMTPGKPDRVYYRGTMRDNARQAMTAMHDHISRVFPDVCPMSPEITGVQKPAPPVPVGVGGPEPHSAKAAKAAARKADRKARKAAKAMAAKRRRLTAKVLEGKITLTSAQKALGIPVAAKKRKPRKPAAVVTKAAVAPPLDAETLKAAVTEATAPLLERVARQDKVLRKQRKTLDAIASQPDTSQAPMRGVAMAATTKTSAAAQPANLQARAELAQENLFRVHMDTWRNDPDPGAREVAWAELNKMIGTRDMTAKQT